jgi:hypothetical protein
MREAFDRLTRGTAVEREPALASVSSGLGAVLAATAEREGRRPLLGMGVDIQVRGGSPASLPLAARLWRRRVLRRSASGCRRVRAGGT